MPEGMFMKVTAGIIATFTLITMLWGALAWGNDAYTHWHDDRYLNEVDFAVAEQRIVISVQNERRMDEFRESEGDITFLEGAIALKHSNEQDATLEELSLSKAKRKYDRLKGQLKGLGI